MGSEGTLIVGSRVAGKYRVVRPMATGGMGEVYEAVHDELSMRVALKVLLKEQARVPEAVERFLREARAAASLGSEHVAKVFDVGKIEDGTPYLAMELLQGEDLEQIAERRGPLPVHQAVGYVLQALEALAEAHAHGIVHRDLKPSNLFLSRSGDRSRVKVLDFGISKLESELGAPAINLTTTRSMLGSPGYMSPEQVRSSKNVDARTDLWSVGVILYELLSGAQAFQGETLGDVFAKIREEPLPPIRTLRPDVPEALEKILARCLERDRTNRFSSAVELAEALRPYASADTDFAARTLGIGTTGNTGRETPPSARRALTVQTRTDWSTRYPQTKSGIVPLALALALSVAAVFALGWVFYDRLAGPGPSSPTAAGPGAPPSDPPAATSSPNDPSPAGVQPPIAMPTPTVVATAPSAQPSAESPATSKSKGARTTHPSPPSTPAAKSPPTSSTGTKPKAYDPDDLGI
ncbi:MAG: protein kinase [Polyangiaceae bacterium]|nr:protein kinase [Polyangiaceae bacterium]